MQSCVAAVDYAYPWDGLIARFKFRGEPGWAQPMAALTLQTPGAVAALQTCDLVVPIPLTTTRLATRGYNQAWELAKALRAAAPGESARNEAMADALVRLGEVPDQHSLSREQRLRNLQGAFAAHPFRAARLVGARVLLVDDVTTTGATLHSAAQALLMAGAQQVSALVFARTPPH
ncbi:ComF family protein [Hydrogenophaga sp.]|uniref:ComF family protein n=1 Tax=Hydrogenophaga sp. TaxID=1904254 RepID=UPI003F6B1C68